MSLSKFAAIAFLLPVTAFADLSYTIQDLGATAPSTLVVAIGLSSNGAYATGSQNPSWTWNNTSGIGSLTTATGLNWQEARGINSSGTVVGYSSSFSPGGQQALLWDGSTFTQFKPAGASSAQAWGITDAGFVIGTAFLSGQGRVFVWDPATNTTTLLSGSGQVVTALTGNGSSTGFHSGPGGANQAIRVDGGIGGLTMTALNTPLGSDFSRGVGLNDHGIVAGYSGVFTSSATNAILWNGTTPAILPGLAGATQNRAQDINNAGLIVGMSRTSLSTNGAVLWQAGMVYDLSLLVTNPIAGVQLDSAVAISENGKILVQGRSGTSIRAYLLTPVPPTTAVPEPGTFAFAALGGMLVWLRRRKRDVSVESPRGAAPYRYPSGVALRSSGAGSHRHSSARFRRHPACIPHRDARTVPATNH